MTDGTVIGSYYFYSGTYAVEVRNDDGTIARYGEIKGVVRKWQRVNKGSVIGTVIANITARHSSMLHIELYDGSGSGPLTQADNHTYTNVPNRNYQRQSDLLDPTFIQYLPLGEGV